MTQKKAIVIVSEGRSGTTYLSSRINAHGGMGQVDEWLDAKPPLSGRGAKAFEALYDKARGLGSSSEGHFGLKLFPRHMLVLEKKYGVDVLQRISEDYDLLCLFVERRDRVAQAISFSRALQTGRWTSQSAQNKGEAVYDFEQLCRLYFLIGESYDFWRSYLAARGLQHRHVYYEDMVHSDDILKACARFFGVSSDDFQPSPLSVQRDKTTETFKTRFEADLRTQNILSHHAKLRAPNVTLGNMAKLASGKQTKPYPFSY